MRHGGKCHAVGNYPVTCDASQASDITLIAICSPEGQTRQKSTELATAVALGFASYSSQRHWSEVKNKGVHETCAPTIFSALPLQPLLLQFCSITI